MGIFSKVFQKGEKEVSAPSQQASSKKDKYVLKKISKDAYIPPFAQEYKDSLFALVANEDIICPNDIEGHKKGDILAKKGDLITYVDQKSYEMSGHFNDSFLFMEFGSDNFIIGSKISQAFLSNSNVFGSIINNSKIRKSDLNNSKVTNSNVRDCLSSGKPSGLIDCDVKDSTILNTPKLANATVNMSRLEKISATRDDFHLISRSKDIKISHCDLNGVNQESLMNSIVREFFPAAYKTLYYGRRDPMMDMEPQGEFILNPNAKFVVALNNQKLEGTEKPSFNDITLEEYNKATTLQSDAELFAAYDNAKNPSKINRIERDNTKEIVDRSDDSIRL